MKETVGEKDTEIPQIVEFKKWLSKAKTGDTYVYFNGTSISSSIIGMFIQRVTFEYARKGKVYLFQYRTFDKSFNYVAVKASNYPPQSLVPLDYLTTAN